MSNFMKEFTTDINGFIENSDGLNVDKFIQRNLKDANLKGDITISIPSIRSSNQDLNVEELCTALTNEVDTIARITTDKKLIRIFLSYPIILKQFPQVFDSLKKCTITDLSVYNKSRIVVINPAYQGDSSIVELRRCVTAKLLMNIFKMINIDFEMMNESENLSISHDNSERKLLLISLHNTIKSYKFPSAGSIQLANALIASVEDTNDKHKQTNVESYMRQIKEEIRQASEHKQSLNGLEWENHLETVTQGCAHLNLLSVSHHINIRFSTAQDVLNFKDEAFILYNYARIETILKNFDESLKQKYLSALPPLEKVDFTILTEKDEWELYWSFIYYWPKFKNSFINEICSKIFRESCCVPISENNGSPILGNNTTLRLPLHRLVKFLHSLSHKLSVFYKYVRILPPVCTGKVPSHFLPKLYARLYLLKAVKIIFEESFDMISIKPPSVM